MSAGNAFCSKCGAPLSADAQFCAKCGASVAGQQPSHAGLAIPLASGGTAYVTANAITITNALGARIGSFAGSDVWEMPRSEARLTLHKTDGTLSTIDTRGSQDASRAKDVFRPVGARPMATDGPASKGHGKAIAIIAGIVIVLIIIGSLAGGNDQKPGPAANPAAARPTSTTRPTTYQVTYKITRSNHFGQMDITYENAQGGSEQVSIVAPVWQQVYTMNPGSFVYISAQNPADSGDISCDILVNGASFRHSQSSGAYVIADCSGSVGN